MQAQLNFRSPDLLWGIASLATAPERHPMMRDERFFACLTALIAAPSLLLIATTSSAPANTSPRRRRTALALRPSRPAAFLFARSIRPRALRGRRCSD